MGVMHEALLVLVLKVPRSVTFVDEGRVRLRKVVCVIGLVHLLLTLEQSLGEVGKLFGFLVVY